MRTFTHLKQMAAVAALMLMFTAAWAQDSEEYQDITASYIQSADCSSLDAWSDNAGVWTVDEGTNMGGAKQKYLQIWTGSKAPACELTQTITLQKGTYRLGVDGIAVSDGQKAAVSDESAVLFASVEGQDVETPFAGVKKAPQTVSVDFEVTEDGAKVVVGIRVKDGSAANWVAVDDFTLLQSAATVQDYRLFKCDFNDGSKGPFRDSWAWNPSYIEVMNDCLEFYYNQEACDADNRRERRGCEVVCDFSTTSEAWYGYRVFLPKGKFAKDLENSIFTQFFNGGRRNSWAGHLSIDGEKVVVSYRHALVDPKKATVGTIEWGKWTDIIVYYRAGRNNKGEICVWMGSDLQEDKPSVHLKNINFGFAENWIDDTHFDPTPYEYGGKEYTDALGGKWGLYVSEGGDRTIRFDNLSVMSGNPEGAFDMVNPANLPASPSFDIETPVESVESGVSDEQSQHSVNLAGQRVGNGYKGIVIKNGKKMILG